MKVTLNWLKQYVDFNWSPEELAERLTMLGLEVEGVQKLGGEFAGVVVGQVLAKDKVAGSDKLSVNRVADGTGDRTIICGAQNHQPGDKVALILPNFALPLKPGEKEPFVIKERKVFGVVSQGMMCSNKELGLGEDGDGIIILPPDAKVGQPFAEHLGRAGSDVVYDLEVTPNRPDLNSVIGIAREIAALTGNPLKLPVISNQRSVISEEVGKFVAVNLQEPELCPRYTARVVTGVKVGPSPDWLRQTLEKVGIRSISNVVDVTNYVMLETGQPLHAFDYHLIAKGADGKPTIVIRRAAAEEKFKTLDNQERTLTADMLLIADEQKGIALAGVMGGANTEIRDDTRDVLIESAYFLPTNIRRTSKALGLRSESSYRFERGCDVGIADYASQRAAQLILETAGGTLVPGVVDAYPNPAALKEISLRFAKTDELLGVAIEPEQQVKLLTSLGLGQLPIANRQSATFSIPTFRVDLKREVDLIEEIARLHGVDKIPSTTPRGAVGTNAFDAVYDQLADVRRLLTGLGLNEAQGQTLVSHANCRLAETEIVKLANPLSADMDVLRPSLLPGLLDTLRHNLHRQNHDVALFEIGRVFTNVNGQPKEERRIAIALTGQRALAFWSGDDRDAKFDAMDLKSLVEDVLEHFGLRGIQFGKRAEPTTLFLESAAVTLGGKVQLGELGQLLPALAKQYDLRDAVFLAELRLDELLARGNRAKSFKPLPQFPASRRDVAMLVPEATTHDSVLSAVKQAKPANLESVELFDVFRGKNVPAGQKSLAYAFTYRASDKTLTDNDVNAAHAKAVDALKQKLQATVRE
ncbi:MAG: phenylalanyl-tRNA synthetase beta chain [Limisphaerales bacterium]|nr:MAG: phenylalanyl-tRNA synthetase beta chain [Limisphaerales bacterium]KAG0509447.1 MAG: phenylalanyl-tRNA synthetase beta chain [Limisphaerales bacterium]TXT52284.1 MAG: phenylalanyl-tRNA synthetase beta chain [Limisphaerales bacterium]